MLGDTELSSGRLFCTFTCGHVFKSAYLDMARHEMYDSQITFLRTEVISFPLPSFLLAMTWSWLVKVNDADKDNTSEAGRATSWKEPGPLDDMME